MGFRSSPFHLPENQTPPDYPTRFKIGLFGSAAPKATSPFSSRFFALEAVPCYSRAPPKVALSFFVRWSFRQRGPWGSSFLPVRRKTPLSLACSVGLGSTVFFFCIKIIASITCDRLTLRAGVGFLMWRTTGVGAGLCVSGCLNLGQLSPRVRVDRARSQVFRLKSPAFSEISFSLSSPYA